MAADPGGSLRWRTPRRGGGLDEGHHPGRRLRHQASPRDPGDQQAAAAGLRQADDLLPDVGPDAGADQRHPDHLVSRRHRPVRAAVPGRFRARPQHQLCGAAEAGGLGPGVPDRRRVHRRRRLRPGFGRQRLLRRRHERPLGDHRGADPRRDDLLVSRRGSHRLWRGRARRRRQGDQPGGKAQPLRSRTRR